jgi:hypothetical protein
MKTQLPQSLFLLPTPLRDYQNHDDNEEENGNVWVKRSDVLDILMLSGTAVSTESLDNCLQHLRNFLPGVISGKFCLQVSIHHMTKISSIHTCINLSSLSAIINNNNFFIHHSLIVTNTCRNY